MDLNQIKNELRENIMPKIDLSRDVSDEEIGGIIDELIISKGKRYFYLWKTRRL